MNLSSIIKCKYCYIYGSLYHVNSITGTVEQIHAICGISTPIQVYNNRINDFAIVNHSTGTADDMIYHVLSLHYTHHEISLVWNDYTSTPLCLQWGYVHCKAITSLAVVQWSNYSYVLVVFFNINVGVNTVISDINGFSTMIRFIIQMYVLVFTNQIIIIMNGYSGLNILSITTIISLIQLLLQVRVLFGMFLYVIINKYCTVY